MMYKKLTEENLQTEHICCAIAEKKGDTCVAEKKAWLRKRMAEGLTFEKLDIRGKVFIEYIPAELAWSPVEAPGYMFLNCLWVSGQYKGQGYGRALLERCVAESRAQGKQGIVAVCGEKKLPFLADPRFLRHMGFQQADEAAPHFLLLYRPIKENAPAPRFRDCARQGQGGDAGWTLYYTHQCPHAAKYAPLFADIARAHGLDAHIVHLDTREAAQNAPCPWTTYALFCDGTFVTNEVLSEKSFEKLLAKRGKR